METNYLIDSDVVISYLKGVEPGVIWMEESKGERLADFDLLIASTALVSKSVLGTGNVKHFKRIKGLKIYKES